MYIEARTKTVNDALNAIQQIKDGNYKEVQYLTEYDELFDYII